MYNFDSVFRYDGDEIVREICLGDSLFVSRMWIPLGFNCIEPQYDWDYLYLRGHKIRYPRIRKQMSVIDLFSGAGGLSFGVQEGLKSIGIEANYTYAVDIDNLALSIHQHNMHTYNVTNQSVTSLIDYTFEYDSLCEYKYKPQPVGEFASAVNSTDILIAGPPCQGFSNLNNYTRRNDDRNLLYLAVPAIAIALNVPIVIIENVREIKSDPHKIVENARLAFEKYGYQVVEYMASGPKLGLAQTRNRHFQIAIKTNHKNADQIMKQVYDTLCVENVRTVDWAIKDLMGKENETLFDTPSELSEENRKRIDDMFERNLQEISKEMRPKSHREMEQLSYQSVYGKLWANKPAGTITTGFYTPGRGRFIHPHCKRTITAHEAARIQGFPDSFEFMLANGTLPNRATLSKTIGDAVPPVFGFAAILCAMAASD
jgi:DNA (cytosine-5)-methyltransferase 1